MARVFISHASVDREWASEIRGWLVADGHEVFLDLHPVDGLIVGEEWERELYRRLRWADAVVCVVTGAYLASVWCAAEVGIAKANGSMLLAVRVEAEVVHPLLKSLQQSNAAAEPAVARQKLAVALRRLDAGGGLGWSDDRSPYPGLDAFDTGRHRVFFGRGRETAEIAELLRKPAARAEPAILLVIGPSGCGKSSLVRAGVIPRIAGEPLWSPLEPIVPGTDPVGALARSLASARRRVGLDRETVFQRDRLIGNGFRDVADEILLAEQAGADRKLLLVIDQFEELLRRTAWRERAEFVDLLLPAIGGPVQVLATLRPEFLEPLGADVALSRIPTRTHPVLPLRNEALRAVIEGPARVAGLTIEDGLVEALLADTGTGDALPLLAFTLEQLAFGLRRGDQLSRQRYTEIGGVRGALARQAETALAEAHTATGLSRDEIITMLLRLVTVDEHGVPTRDRVPRTGFTESAQQAIDAFVTHRLLATAEEDGQIVVSPAHEAFLRNWAPLRDAISREGDSLRARRAVEIAATEWANDDHKPQRLWERDRLAVAMKDTGARLRLMPQPQLRQWPPRLRRLSTTRVETSSRAKEFLERSYRRDRFRRGRATVALSALLCAALVAAVIAIVQQRQAVARQHTAVARQLLAQADQLRDLDPRMAIRLGLVADRLDPGNETRQWLINMLSTTRYAGTLDGPPNSVSRLAFSPDGRTIAVQQSGGTVALWGLSDSGRAQQLGEPLTDVSDITDIAFTPDGKTLLTGAAQDLNARYVRSGLAPSVEAKHNPSSVDGLIQWDITDPARPHIKARSILDIWEKLRFQFAPVPMLAIGYADKQPTQLWDLNDPEHPVPAATISPPEAEVDSAEFSPDGRLLAIATRGTITIWDVSDRHAPRSISRLTTTGQGLTQDLVFSPDGRQLAASVFPRGLTRWDITDPARPRLHPNSGPNINSGWSELAFGPTGNDLAIAPGSGNGVGLYEIPADENTARLRARLVGGATAATAIAFSAKGILAIGGRDGRTTLWTIDAHTQPQPVGRPFSGEVDQVAGACGVATSGDLIAVGGKNGKVDLWETGQRDGPVHTVSFDAEHLDYDNNVRISCVALSSDGKTLATGSPDRTVSLWDVGDRRHPRRLGPPLTGLAGIVTTLAFSPDGTRLAAGSYQNSLVWSIEQREAPKRLGRGVHGGPMAQVSFTADGRLHGVGWVHRTLTIWDLTDSDQPVPLGGIPLELSTQIAYSPAAGVLVVIKHGAGQFWDVSDPAHAKPVGNAVLSDLGRDFRARFDSTGTILATFGSDQVQMWLVTDPAHPTQIGEPRNVGAREIMAAAFTADSSRLVTGHEGGAAVAWDLHRLHELRRKPAEIGCTTVGSSLSPEGWRQYIQELPYRDTC
ncbi:TIR domain-containing protein [Nocardia sp. CS682]|uniref:nSTAND1 domain-containing NTPase n=1 Tax=Nocardia sp. CS682 TaxID=1047172 RepID=UPI0014321217|nr:TIR domain-containing protein [Nocardia sp. CS682]